MNSVDQRGVMRPVFGASSVTCDIGAFEVAQLVGEACSNDTECDLANCVDGICCPADCMEVCESCAAAVTGQADGTCAPVQAGMQTGNGCDAAAEACNGAETGVDACDAVLGEACGEADECLSGFCSDGVCCDSACSGSGVGCVLPGMVGECRPVPAPVPALSAASLAFLLFVLGAVAWVAMRRSRVSGSPPSPLT